MNERRNQWQENSFRALSAALERVLARLEGSAKPSAAIAEEPSQSSESALDRVVAKFGLTTFERDLLLLCAGVELDARFPRRIAALQEDERLRRPTFSLALSRLETPHWSALASDGVLRRARLISIGSGAGLSSSPLAVEEALLHYLAGLAQLDERLLPLLDALPPPAQLTPGQEEAAAGLIQAWSRHSGEGQRVRVQLVSRDPLSAQAVTAAACGAIGLGAFAVSAEALPAEAAALEEVRQLWERDAILNDFALLIDLCGVVEEGRRRTLRRLIDRLQGFVAVVADAPLPSGRTSLTRIEVPAPSAREQRSLWTSSLGSLAQSLNGEVGRLVQQFSMPPAMIRDVSEQIQAQAQAEEGHQKLPQTLWQTCRKRARGGLDELAQRIQPRAGWDDLVLPQPQKKALTNLARQVRHRWKVYEDWGFAAKSSRGFGVSALFWGPSGAGKTMAGEVLAGQLQLDLYRIDLSAAVSKYIGETEKNLCRIFDAAEASGAILLFDESDALFGKRSEVKDSHDRYSNIEVSYLLQRIEQYRGLAILTTNLKNALDQAFLRRLRFILHFPFPSGADRARIWQRIFPQSTPLQELDFKKLSRLSVTGGNIANIALDAAFRAADQGTAVGMQHILQGARAEYSKIEKPLSEIEVRGWA